jgi:hypothetical protein
MRSCTPLFRGSLLAAALLIAASAAAQELQLDPKALDTSGASSVQVKRKGKKGADAAAPQAGPSGKAGAAGGPNRQFGELEGWSPGKEPPKPKDGKDSSSTSSKPTGVGVSPSGNMSVGLPF